MNDRIPERRRGFRFRKLYDQLGGSTLTFAWVLLILGTGLALSGRLTAEWIALAGIIQALVTLRAAAEDKYVRGNGNGSAPVSGR